MLTEAVHLEGHIIDSLTLTKVLDLIQLLGGTYEITGFRVGATSADTSRADILVRAASAGELEAILHQIGQHGAMRPIVEAVVQPAAATGVLPDGFYATTNLQSFVRWHGHWIPVERMEMDCCIVLTTLADRTAALCTPMHRVREGDLIVVGDSGVRVEPMPRRDPASVFGFMGSDVSTERPKELVVAGVADAVRAAHAAGRRVLFVGGPAIVHTGAAPYLEAMIAAGWIDVVFAGNALAAHDIERAIFGTSLGVELATGAPAAHGHEHHLRAINAVRAVGGIRQAVDAGLLKTGVMHACTVHNVDYVLAGSIRDDGPLPDVITDSVAAQDRMRDLVQGVDVAIMVATTLHSVATGNLLPATVMTVCVDSDPDTVTKLQDRGTLQAYGLVTDCEFFLKELAARLT